MSLSLISTTGASSVVNALALYKLANGEYSAGGVAADPRDASKLDLTRLKDGNYGSLLSSVAFAMSASPASSSSFGVQAALSTLVLGG